MLVTEMQDLLELLTPQHLAYGVDIQGFPTNQLHFHGFKLPVKLGLYQQPAKSLSLWSSFILCCRRLASRRDGSILCSRSESSLGDHHGSHFQLSSSLRALSVCVQHWFPPSQRQYIITAVKNGLFL